jgi:hypothetical protein
MPQRVPGEDKPRDSKAQASKGLFPDPESGMGYFILTFSLIIMSKEKRKLFHRIPTLDTFWTQKL